MSERHVPDNQKTASSYISSGIGRSCLPKMSCIFSPKWSPYFRCFNPIWERDLRERFTGKWCEKNVARSDHYWPVKIYLPYRQWFQPPSSQISYQPRIGQLIYAWEWPFFFFVFSSEQHFLLPSHRWLLECSSCRCFCCWTTHCDLFGKGRSSKCRWLLPLPPLTASWVLAPVFSFFLLQLQQRKKLLAMTSLVMPWKFALAAISVL